MTYPDLARMPEIVLEIHYEMCKRGFDACGVCREFCRRALAAEANRD